MEIYQPTVEKDPAPKDISAEFLSMSSVEFSDFLKSQRKEPTLSIEIDWTDVPTARRLKAFLEDSRAYDWKQKRSAKIRATEEQYKQELNVFASGVLWQKV